MKKIVAIVILTVLMTGCTSVQKVSKLESGKANLVCVVEHKAVRESVLKVVQDGLNDHGVRYRVIQGTYEIKNNLWMPTFQDDQVAGCDAVLFYVATWKWDITMYMDAATIWMSTPDRSKKLGEASYGARASLNKFINAEAKLHELIDGLFEQYKRVGQNDTKPSVAERVAVPTVTPVAASAPAVAITMAKTETKSADAAPSVTSQKLRELQTLRKDGLISEEDFQNKKKQLLEKM